MKATELRIGNWIKLDGMTTKVTHFTIFDLHNLEIAKENTIAYQPIKISRLKLKRLGFEKMENNCYVQGWYSLNTPFYLFYSKKNGFSYNADLPVSIEYVHELQNLYFAITGCELETK